MSHQVGPGPGWSLIGGTDVPSTDISGVLKSKGIPTALRGSLSLSSISSLATSGAAGLSGALPGPYNSSNASSIPQSISRDSPPQSPLNPNATFASAEMNHELQKTAGRVLFYVSAANWNIVFTRIKARFTLFAQNAAENDGDLTEIKMLEWCSLNRVRLGQVLQGADALSAFSHCFLPRKPKLIQCVKCRVYDVRSKVF